MAGMTDDVGSLLFERGDKLGGGECGRAEVDDRDFGGGNVYVRLGNDDRLVTEGVDALGQARTPH